MTYDEIIEAWAQARWRDDIPETLWHLVRGDVQDEYREACRCDLRTLRTLAEEQGYRLMVPVEATDEQQDAMNRLNHPRDNELYAAALSAAPDPTEPPKETPDAR